MRICTLKAFPGTTGRQLYLMKFSNSVHNGQFDLTGSQQFLTATAASALTGNLFETFIVSEILKSFCSLPAEYI